MCIVYVYIYNLDTDIFGEKQCHCTAPRRFKGFGFKPRRFISTFLHRPREFDRAITTRLVAYTSTAGLTFALACMVCGPAKNSSDSQWELERVQQGPMGRRDVSLMLRARAALPQNCVFPIRGK